MTAIAAFTAGLDQRPVSRDELAQVLARIAALEARLAAGVRQPRVAEKSAFWVGLMAGTIAEEFGITRADIMGECRSPRLVRPRFTFVWCVKTVARLSYPAAARLTNYDNHTSVLHACRRVEGWRAASPEFRHVTDLLVDIGRQHRLAALRQPLAGNTADLVALIETLPVVAA